MTTKFTGGTTPAYFSTQRPCEHRWNIITVSDMTGSYSIGLVQCWNDGCEATMGKLEAEAMLNEHAGLKALVDEYKPHVAQLDTIIKEKVVTIDGLEQQVERLREFIRLHGKHLPHEVWLDAVDLLEEE